MSRDQSEHHGQSSYDPSYDPSAEVVDLCRDLIRIDTSNYGDESGPGERKAAEHVATLLDEVGIGSDLFELESGRTSLVAQWGGNPGGEGALLLHGHLDVVPAAAEDWQVDPFSGEIRGGDLWGRRRRDKNGVDAIGLVRPRARARRRRRQEGLRRHAALGGPGAHAGGRAARAADRALLPRRRGGRRPPRCP